MMKKRKKNGAIKDAKFYAEWNKAHKTCAACGSSNNLTTHHIVKLGRSDEPANLLRLCFSCHRRAEGEEQIANGIRVPILTIANVLWLKREQNPDEYDFERLVQLRMSNLPEPEIPGKTANPG